MFSASKRQIRSIQVVRKLAENELVKHRMVSDPG